jgi:N-acetylglucosamine-6-phosphate deacetylase
VILTADGKLHLAENPALLAGSAQMIAPGVAHLVRSGLAGLAAAWEMASVRPATLMGLPAARGISAGAPGDVVLFDWDGERVTVRETYKKGELVYHA